MGDHARDSIEKGMMGDRPFGPRRSSRSRNRSSSSKSPQPPKPPEGEWQGDVFGRWHDELANDPTSGYDNMSAYEIAWLAWEQAYKRGLNDGQDS